MQKYLQENFLDNGQNGLISDVEIVFIDKTDPSEKVR